MARRSEIFIAPLDVDLSPNDDVRGKIYDIMTAPLEPLDDILPRAPRDPLTEATDRELVAREGEFGHAEEIPDGFDAEHAMRAQILAHAPVGEAVKIVFD